MLQLKFISNKCNTTGLCFLQVLQNNSEMHLTFNNIGLMEETECSEYKNYTTIKLNWFREWYLYNRHQ